MPSTVLVVDDEQTVRDTVTLRLEQDGHRVIAAADGAEALRQFRAEKPDLILLDLMLPELSGIEITRIIRGESDVPILMLTARDSELDKVVGLELGADDYVSKPFSPREVVARVQAVLRRAASQDPVQREAPLLRFDGLEIDPGPREVRVDGEEIALTPKEFELLLFLASSPRVVFSRAQLLEELWDLAFEGDPSVVTVHVRRLREKIESDPSAPRRLITVWGVGYRFEP
jgi:two-component system, OmpR family, phosphate regulon response regulator PhoB